MINFTIRVAGQTVGIAANFESTRKFCSHYRCDEKAACSIEITQKDIAFEREKSAREAVLEGLPVRHFTDAYLETLAVQRQITENFFQKDILLFHGSVVAVDGEGYLFTAKSGTGKSTHTRLWRQIFGDRAVMINDDKPFLCFVDGKITVCGTPWMGKHGLGENRTVPLKAICILERDEGNHIERIPAKDAVMMLLQQSSRPGQPQNMPKYLELIDRLAAGTAFYRLRCNMDPEAAWVAFDGMRT